MDTTLELTWDNGEFVARLTRDQALAMYEALAFLRHRDDGDRALALRLGCGPEVVDSIIERLHVDHTGWTDARFRQEELHVVHSALTSAATVFTSRGRLLQEPFHIRLGFLRENFDALAVSLVHAASEAME
ncbi:hypothetical protein DF268_26770 [Streptomyces sp. V2]|uniref:hypothetical protein n=1 Tax=Streptomyces TaxID=1883 RepID=UPI0006EB2DDE|nr:MULTISPECIES: hypothetical protein [Streptomyces]PWG10534.1 hypothetical protein DF268_26770 [Streptomyces sp. V2]